MAGRNYEGVVTSAKMTKTLVVKVVRRAAEGMTGKVVSSNKKYKVHCENKAIKEGDLIRFVDCRPMSKDKKWRFTDLVKKGETFVQTKDEPV